MVGEIPTHPRCPKGVGDGKAIVSFAIPSQDSREATSSIGIKDLSLIPVPWGEQAQSASPTT